MTFIPDSVRAQLRHAFSETAGLDTAMFLSILDHEGVHLTPDEISALVWEMSEEAVARSRATFRRVNRIVRYVEDPAKRARLSRNLTSFLVQVDRLPAN